MLSNPSATKSEQMQNATTLDPCCRNARRDGVPGWGVRVRGGHDPGQLEAEGAYPLVHDYAGAQGFPQASPHALACLRGLRTQDHRVCPGEHLCGVFYASGLDAMCDKTLVLLECYALVDLGFALTPMIAKYLGIRAKLLWADDQPLVSKQFIACLDRAKTCWIAHTRHSHANQPEWLRARVPTVAFLSSGLCWDNSESSWCRRRHLLPLAQLVKS